MPHTPARDKPIDSPRTSEPVPLIRGALGGALMGLANLVPGVSGGTMLVAAGIYDRFIEAVSSFTRFRWNRPTLLLLCAIGLGAVVALGGGAKLVSIALTDARWQTYSLFIGLTLGGIPAMLGLCRPLSARTWIGMVAGIGIMLVLVVIQSRETAGSSGGSGWAMLIVGGAAGASAMILPGVSGAYLLLLLGQYRQIIDAVRDAVTALTSGDMAGLLSSVGVLLPVGVGVVLGIVGVSNLLRVALEKARALTMGLLLGLLIAAPAGLWPFKEAVPPQIGETFRRQVVTEDTLSDASDRVNARYWSEVAFTPTAGQMLGSFGMVALGAGITCGISVIGRRFERSRATQTEAVSEAQG